MMNDMRGRGRIAKSLLSEARDVMPRKQYREFRNFIDRLDPPQQSLPFRKGIR